MRTLILSTLLVFSAAGCSNQWREGNSDITSEEMLAALDEAGGASGSSSGSAGVSEALQFKDDGKTSIYFGDAPRMEGDKVITPVASLLSLTNFEFLGAGQISWDTLTGGRVFLLNTPQDGGSFVGLIIGVQTDGGSFSYYGFSGQGVLGEDLFEVTLSSGGQPRLILRSYDVTDGELMNVIQLRVFDAQDNYIGKFSTLVGFGP